MRDNYWLHKNVLITGINGFIGGNVSKALIEKGANVFGLIRNLNKHTYLFFEELADNVVLIKGELNDKELMARIISEDQINVVFHLAAQVEVGIGLSNPYLTFETNIRGTYTLLEAVRLYPDRIEAVVVASTDKVYGSYSKDKMPYKEDYPLIPKYPYDTSKACADMLSRTYASDIYNLPITVTRFSNIYGPGQLNFSALIPDCIISALGNSKFIPRSDGSMIRDFLFVEDVAELYLKISEKLAKEPETVSGEIFNAGTNSPISIREIIGKIYSLIGNNEELQNVLRKMKGKKPVGEISCQFMDYVKVKDYFNWQPKHSVDEGLLKSINWYKRYIEIKT